MGQATCIPVSSICSHKCIHQEYIITYEQDDRSNFVQQVLWVCLLKTKGHKKTEFTPKLTKYASHQLHSIAFARCLAAVKTVHLLPKLWQIIVFLWKGQWYMYVHSGHAYAEQSKWKRLPHSCLWTWAWERIMVKCKSLGIRVQRSKTFRLQIVSFSCKHN